MLADDRVIVVTVLTLFMRCLVTIVVILAIDGLVVARVVLRINIFVVMGKFGQISVVIIS